MTEKNKDVRKQLNFRAWDTIGNNMINPGGEQIIVTNIGVIKLDGHTGILLEPINKPTKDRFKIMLGSGLKDVNGFEIYDCDIVYFTVFEPYGGDIQYTGVVEFTGTRFVIYKTKSEYKNFNNSGLLDLDLVVEQDHKIKIIGNIYQNKELLDGKK